MATEHGVWGIDVGQCALKALRLEVIDGVVTATAFDYVEHPKILSQPDADPDQLTREALETFLSRNEIKGDTIAMSVAGQSGLARFVKLPPVEEKKIADIVRFEAKQQIPFPLDEVVWDFQKIGSGTVTDGFAMDTEIGLFAMKRDMVSRFLHHFQAVNVEVHVVQMAPLALCNYVAYDLLKREADGKLPEGVEVPDDTPPGKKRCAVALDIGTDGSSLIITDGERIIWQRPIPIGGNHFTRALTKELKLTFAKAEHLKRNAAKSPDLAKILKALKPVLTDFVNEVQRSLGYFTNTHRDAHIAFMVGVGSAFRLPGLQKFLSEKLALEVRKPAALERLSGDTVVSAPAFTEHLLTFPVAYGLALQGLGLSRLTTNLLPQEIRMERMIRAKKPWSVAAAAALLVGIFFVSLGFGMRSQSLGQPIKPEEHPGDKIAEAVKEAASATKQASEQQTKATTKKTEILNTTKEVKAIIAGKDERANWIRLNEFVSKCLPRPDFSNLRDFTKLNPPQRVNQHVYRTAEAQRAYEQYRQRLVGEGNVADLPLDDAALQQLVNVDVEAIFPVYVDDLKAFYTNAKNAIKEKQNEEIEQSLDLFVPPGEGGQAGKKYSENLPDGSGWVVEVRGHTYYQGTRNKSPREFLMETVVFNLNYNGFGKGLVPFTKEGPIVGQFPDPIEGRVSHAFLMFAYPVNDPEPGNFQYINKSYVRELASSAAGGAGGAGAGINPAAAMMGGAGGAGAAGGADANSGRASWQPLGHAAGSGGGLGGGPGAGRPGGGGADLTGMMGQMSKMMSMPKAGPAAATGGGTGSGPTRAAGPAGGGDVATGGPGGAAPGRGAGAAATKPNVKRVRREFVVMFVWREPVGVGGEDAPGK